MSPFVTNKLKVVTPMPGIPVFLCCFIVFMFWLRYEIRKSDRISDNQNDSFWEKERQASFSRKKDLSNLNYITIPIDQLPFSINTNQIPDALPGHECSEIACTDVASDETVHTSSILETEEQILKLKDKKIVNFTGITNTQLKLDYGVANLEELSEYDHNFTKLVCLLNTWGNLLHQENRDEEAIQVLSYAVDQGSDVSSSYLLLGQLYYEKNEPSKINRLIDQAEQLNSLSKTRIIRELTELLNKV